MKQIKYPARLTVPVDKENGKKLDELCRLEHRDRPGCFIRALEFYFAHVVSVREREPQLLQKVG